MIADRRKSSSSPRAAWIEEFVNDLAAVRSGRRFLNFYSPEVDGSAERRHNLTLYLRQMEQLNPSFLLVGEAPGYRGTRVTGVPFADCRLVDSGIPELSMLGTTRGYRLPVTPEHPRKEQTSGIVWQVLSAYQFVPLLWAAFPFHPYGERGMSSNRTPTTTEVKIGEPFVTRLLETWEIQHLIAVGRVAERTMKRMGFAPRHIRHPARGGRCHFEQGIAELAK